LLSRADLRADVGLDARQTAEAERAIADLYARAVAVRGKSGPEAIAARKAVAISVVATPNSAAARRSTCTLISGWLALMELSTSVTPGTERTICSTC
jgi:hypothetical protein